MSSSSSDASEELEAAGIRENNGGAPGDTES
jgi:hypothetical protein